MSYNFSCQLYLNKPEKKRHYFWRYFHIIVLSYLALISLSLEPLWSWAWKINSLFFVVILLGVFCTAAFNLSTGFLSVLIFQKCVKFFKKIFVWTIFSDVVGLFNTISLGMLKEMEMNTGSVFLNQKANNDFDTSLERSHKLSSN